MKKEFNKEDSQPHFVSVTNPEAESWKTNIYFGLRDGSGSHSHLVISGALIWYLRGGEEKEIIKEGKPVVKNQF